MRSTEPAFSSIMKSHLSAGTSCTFSPMWKPPARLHSASIRPKRAITAPVAAEIETVSDRSTTWRSTSPAPAVGTLSSAAWLRSSKARFAPSAAKRAATAWPRLPAAPVMTTVWPLKLMRSSLGAVSAARWSRRLCTVALPRATGSGASACGARNVPPPQPQSVRASLRPRQAPRQRPAQLSDRDVALAVAAQPVLERHLARLRIHHDAARQQSRDVAEITRRADQDVGGHHVVQGLERVAADVEGAAGLGERAEIGGIAFRIEIDGERAAERRQRPPHPRDLAQHHRIGHVEVAVALRVDVAAPQMDRDREAARRAVRVDLVLRAPPVACTQIGAQRFADLDCRGLRFSSPVSPTSSSAAPTRWLRSAFSTRAISSA